MNKKITWYFLIGTAAGIFLGMAGRILFEKRNWILSKNRRNSLPERNFRNDPFAYGEYTL